MMSARERVGGGGQGGGVKQGGSTASAHLQGTWDGMDRVREPHKRWCERTDTRAGECEVVASVPTLERLHEI